MGATQNKVAQLQAVVGLTLKNQLVAQGAIYCLGWVLGVIIHMCLDHPLHVQCRKPRGLIEQLGDEIISSIGAQLDICKKNICLY